MTPAIIQAPAVPVWQAARPVKLLQATGRCLVGSLDDSGLQADTENDSIDTIPLGLQIHC